VNLRVSCPQCEASSHVAAPLPASWACPACEHEIPIRVTAVGAGEALPHCATCKCEQVYRQKNFPQWLGLTILAVACAAFFILQGLYEPRIAWVILLGSAAFDGILYLFVGDVIICYRCHTRHYGVPRHRSYQPFELAIAEKYRQERLRREMHASETRSGV
jgi:hypothetical protein